MNTYSTFGKVTSDVRLIQTASGNIATFNVADNLRKKINGEWGWVTMFVECVSYGKQAETIVNRLHRGDEVFVTGELLVDSYTSKDGSEKYAVKLSVDRFKMSHKDDAGLQEHPVEDLPL